MTNPKFKNHVQLLGGIAGSTILGITWISLAGGPPPTKPVNSNTPTNAVQTPIPTTPQPSITPTKPTSPTVLPIVESGNPNTSNKKASDQSNINQPTSTTSNTGPKAPIKFPRPAANIKGKNGLVVLDLVNRTQGVIFHQATGVTKEASLGGGKTANLPNLRLPLNFNYRRQDGGLLLVEVKVIDQEKLQVIFHPTANIDYDTRSISINKDGGVFLN